MPRQAIIAGIPQSGIDSLATWSAACTFGRLPPVVDAEIFCSEAALARFAANRPGDDIILCLRNPVDLAWALHARTARSRKISTSDFGTAWPGYRDLVRQGTRLTFLLSLVERERIHLVVHGDLENAPETVGESIYRFLSCPADVTHENPRLRMIEPRVADSRPASSPKHLRDRLSRFAGRAATCLGGKRKNADREICAIPPCIRERVAADLSEDVALTSVLADRDLSHWL